MLMEHSEVSCRIALGPSHAASCKVFPKVGQAWIYAQCCWAILYLSPLLQAWRKALTDLWPWWEQVLVDRQGGANQQQLSHAGPGALLSVGCFQGNGCASPLPDISSHHFILHSNAIAADPSGLLASSPPPPPPSLPSERLGPILTRVRARPRIFTSVESFHGNGRAPPGFDVCPQVGRSSPRCSWRSPFWLLSRQGMALYCVLGDLAPHVFLTSFASQTPRETAVKGIAP